MISIEGISTAGIVEGSQSLLYCSLSGNAPFALKYTRPSRQQEFQCIKTYFVAAVRAIVHEEL